MIEQLFGGKSTAVFLRDFYLRLPYALPGGAESLRSLANWRSIEGILARPDADVLVVREGKRWEGKERPTSQQARELHDAGYTILIRHAEQHDARLAELTAGWYDDFRAPIDIHIYCTPATQHGFGWHYDAEDVFIIQTEGTKEYSLRKNTVNPWPLVDTLPDDMGFEREIMPVMQCTLAAGDWLYIPNGYWHMARASESSISLAIGILSPSAIELFDFLRARLVSSLLWRQRLPTSGNASPLSDAELAEHYAALTRDLADDLAIQMRDKTLVCEFLTARGR